MSESRPAASSAAWRMLERLLDRFDQAWQSGVPPAIEDFLPVRRGGRRRALRELVKIDLEYRWKQSASADPPPRLEDYVARLPRLGSPWRMPLDLICEEYRVRQRWGDRPDHAEYARRFPQHGAALRAALVCIDADLRDELPTVCVRPRGAAPPRPAPCPSAETADGPAARRLGRYELGELLGTGAFGSVWQAWDAELGREVAIKLPRSGRFPGPAEEERFLREARAAAQLHHPGIVAVHDVGREDETLYIVSELVRGVSLAERLRDARLSFREAAELVAQVSDALAYAHRQGVVHRDVKPSNILLSGEWRVANGEKRQEESSSLATRHSPLAARVQLCDFGLALRDASEAAMTVDGQLLGTPAYMSPEQVRDPHAVDGRSDVYSLGVILYELLTGELPFRGATQALLAQAAADEPRPPRRRNARIPRDLETICLKCLHKDPRRRYQAAGALAADLRCWQAGEPIAARPVGRLERLWLWAKRNRALAVTAGLGAAALVAVAGAPAATALTAVAVGSLLFALHKARIAADLSHAVGDTKAAQKKTAAALQFALRHCAGAGRAAPGRRRRGAGDAPTCPRPGAGASRPFRPARPDRRPGGPRVPDPHGPDLSRRSGAEGRRRHRLAARAGRRLCPARRRAGGRSGGCAGLSSQGPGPLRRRGRRPAGQCPGAARPGGQSRQSRRSGAGARPEQGVRGQGPGAREDGG